MDMELSFNNMLEDLSNYLIKPQAKVQYTYDAAGNRLTMTNDDGTTDYTYQWEEILSAKDVAKQNQEEIAKYGIPPNAKIVSRQGILPQQYYRYIQRELDRQFKKIEPIVPNKSVKFGNVLDGIQLGLDIFGMIPVIGEAADGINGVIYAARGDTMNAALSFSAMIPGVGNVSTIAKFASKGAHVVDTTRIVRGFDSSRALNSTRKVANVGESPPKMLMPLDLQYFGSKGKGKDVPSGGAYKDVPSNGGEVHHMPANSVSPLSRGNGPGVRMETIDHRQTASWGNSREARAYRAQQKSLIEQGKFNEAQNMDIIDLRNKFGNKYDEGIRQMLEYTKRIK